MRTKGLMDRSNSIEGIYNNARFMHSSASLLGCVIQVHTVGGPTFEGIFRTLSPQCEIVLEMAHKVDKNATKQAFGTSVPTKDAIIQKLIVKPIDIELLSAKNADMEYGTKDVFTTDSVISKCSNWQSAEKELEPWDEPMMDGGDISILEADSSNGWDVNEMFRTNEQQYGVQSTYDSTLSGYTLPLEKKNTDDYKKKEERASKIANEIESSNAYKERIALEDVDEDEKISSVVRTNDNPNCPGRYLPTGKRKTHQVGGGKMTRSTPSPQSSSSYGGSMSSSAIRPMHGGTTHSHSMTSSSPHPMHMTGSSPQGPPPSHVVITSSRQQQQQMQHHHHPQSLPPPQSSSHHVPHHVQPLSHGGPPLQPVPSGGGSGVLGSVAKPPVALQVLEHQVTEQPDVKTVIANGSKADKEEKKHPGMVITPISDGECKVTVDTENCRELETSKISGGGASSVINNEVTAGPPPSVMTTLQQPAAAPPPGVTPLTSQTQLTVNHISKGPRKIISPKVSRDEETADLKKFKSNFKLSEENKEDINRGTPEEGERKEKAADCDVEKISSTLKKSTLNPNAKEFVLNPNAKSFTPRSPSTQIPTPPRQHTPGPIMAQPSTIPVVHSQHIFNPIPAQYIMATTPISAVPLTATPITAATMPQGPRLRKTNPGPLQQRPDFSPSMQVAAATGQPILASTSITAPTFVQYTPQGMVPAHGTAQHSMPYTQMYSMVTPRLMAAQGMTMVPTSHLVAHHDAQHLQSQMFVSAHPGVPQPLPPGPTQQHPAQAMTPGGPHQNQSQNQQQQGPLGGQGQVTGMHPNPSPVHGNGPNQPSQPGTPGTLHPSAYQPAHAQMGQPPNMQPGGPHTPNSPQTMHPGAAAAAQSSSMGAPPPSNNPHYHPGSIVTHATGPGGGVTHNAGQGHQHPGQATAFATGGPQQMVLIHQQGPGTPSPMASHSQGVPTHTLQGHALHGHVAAPGQVAHLLPHTSMTLPIIPATSTSSMSMAPHQIFIQHPSGRPSPMSGGRVMCAVPSQTYPM